MQPELFLMQFSGFWIHHLGSKSNLKTLKSRLNAKPQFKAYGVLGYFFTCQASLHRDFVMNTLEIPKRRETSMQHPNPKRSGILYPKSTNNAFKRATIHQKHKLAGPR